MYQAFEDYIIAVPFEPKTASGLIMTVNDNRRFVVTNTCAHTKQLEGKVVEVDFTNSVRPLTDNEHVAINYKTIVAIYEQKD